MPGRLVVRRIPDLNHQPGQDSLFHTWRFHAFFTTSTLDTVAADKIHRGHAIIEQVHADLKLSALAHLPSGKFCANAAWLVLRGDRVQPDPSRRNPDRPDTGQATTATIRRTLIIVPARIAYSARRITLHLPQHWPWETGWTTLFTRSLRTTAPAPADHPAGDGATKDQEHPGREAWRISTAAHQTPTDPQFNHTHAVPRWIEA